MTKYFFNTEFIEDGKTIDLISIGIVCEDGRELYLENTDCDFSKADDWVKENVLGKLSATPEFLATKQEIAKKVQDFIKGNRADNELWAYYSAYDHVVLCQLFGKMIDLPDSIPMFTNDLMQLLSNRPDIQPVSSNIHNALDDAKWLKNAYDFVINFSPVKH